MFLARYLKKQSLAPSSSCMTSVLQCHTAASLILPMILAILLLFHLAAFQAVYICTIK